MCLLQPSRVDSNDGWHHKVFAYGPLASTPLDKEPESTQFLGPINDVSISSSIISGSSRSSSDRSLGGSTTVPPASPSSMHPAAALAQHTGVSRASVAWQDVQGSMVMHLACNLFEEGTGGHEWGSGFRLAELLLSEPEMVQGQCLHRFHRSWTRSLPFESLH